jgi:hypothetical protein
LAPRYVVDLFIISQTFKRFKALCLYIPVSNPTRVHQLPLIMINISSA